MMIQIDDYAYINHHSVTGLSVERRWWWRAWYVKVHLYYGDCIYVQAPFPSKKVAKEHLQTLLDVWLCAVEKYNKQNPQYKAMNAFRKSLEEDKWKDEGSTS